MRLRIVVAVAGLVGLAACPAVATAQAPSGGFDDITAYTGNGDSYEGFFSDNNVNVPSLYLQAPTSRVILYGSFGPPRPALPVCKVYLYKWDAGTKTKTLLNGGQPYTATLNQTTNQFFIDITTQLTKSTSYKLDMILSSGGNDYPQPEVGFTVGN